MLKRWEPIKFSLGIALGLGVFNSLIAAETDQYYARDAIIRDSSDELNGYFHQRIELALKKVNQSSRVESCREVAQEVLTQVLGEFNLVNYAKERTFSKVSKFTQEDPSVDRFPPDSLDQKIYRKDSIYKKRPFPTNVVGIAQTINVDGIYMGTDKIGHFSIVGKAYYSNFLEALDKGASVEEATVIAIEKGFKQEIAILGYTVGGTLSYADLEANYQGLVFGRNMCEGTLPHLENRGGKWVHSSVNPFDIRAYVNPKYDEAFNESFWSNRVWKKMKKEIIHGYCENKRNNNYQVRLQSYLPRVKETINDELIAKLIKNKPKFDRKKQLHNLNLKCE
jgi:hypothetical protein